MFSMSMKTSIALVERREETIDRLALIDFIDYRAKVGIEIVHPDRCDHREEER
jgi:hypothetical protein